MFPSLVRVRGRVPEITGRIDGNIIEGIRSEIEYLDTKTRTLRGQSHITCGQYVNTKPNALSVYRRDNRDPQIGRCEQCESTL